ncbi:hypothetical protein [Streptomyces sp. ODS05-4]|uniref:hypothetical protein n=1 Tax=Streptomyces sp. ODS05-4 TaxID=2944939 RepID=UPI002108D0F7|nr:hypothetical protein [Streptomyces sp. ODS05-4]
MSLGDEHGGRGGGAGQTRTRLPDSGSPDAYGPPHRAPRASRSLITVVGVVVLLIAAIAFANRGPGTDGDDSDAAPRAKTAPTAATGVPPATGRNGPVPAGFAHDEQGAQSAAANYAVALVSAEILKPERRAEIVGQVFTPDQAGPMREKLDQAYGRQFLDKVGLDDDGNAAPGMTYVSRTAPMGTKVVEASSDAATVEVWCTGVFGTAGLESTNPVTNDWFTMTLNLRWADGDWKVAGFSQKEGPAPVNADRKISSADEIAKAVAEFGGFTYAR